MLSEAIERARANPIIRLPKMAAMIYQRNYLIGVGWNQHKSHPLAARYGKHKDAIYLHAELAAIVYAIRTGNEDELRGSTMYIARVLKNGEPALAKPCEGCMRALAAFDIQNVEWTE